MADKVPVSVVILAKNEAGRLRECIASAAWADEVLVVDDHSTDETAALAASLGAKVVRRAMDVEGRHRNWAHAQASHEWVFSLDADERITPELAQSIREVVASDSSLAVYDVPRRNFIGRRWIQHGGWYPSAQVKLFKRSRFRWEEASVHPRAIADSATGNLRGDLLHYSYRDLADFVEKMNRQTTLEAQKWVADDRRMQAGKALWRSVDRWWRSYVGKQGHRDGAWGWIVAVLGGMYQFLSYAKYWHATHPAPADQRAAVPEAMRRPWPAQGRARLSVLLLTKNEEQKLPKCLESLRWADEIVVVDGQSTDRTVEIVAGAGARVVSRPFSGSFGEERNAGLAAATGDWVLQMDADETVSPELHAAIGQLLAKGSPHAALQVGRRNFFLGRRMRFGGWYHYNTVLFRRAKCRYEGRVHERLVADGTTGRIAGDLLHRPFDSIEQFVARQNRYTSLLSREQQEQGIRPDAAQRQLRLRPRKIFWKTYVKKQAFREGMPGLIFAALFAWVEFLTWAKAFEACDAPPAPAPDPVPATAR